MLCYDLLRKQVRELADAAAREEDDHALTRLYRLAAAFEQFLDDAGVRSIAREAKHVRKHVGALLQAWNRGAEL